MHAFGNTPGKLLACIALFAAAAVRADASDDRLLLFLAHPSIDLRAGAGTTIAVGITANTQTGLPDGEAPVPPIAIDPKAMAVSYRRIDATVRPWQRLSIAASPGSAAPTGGAGAGSIAFSFGTIPAVRGATYEVRADVAGSIMWAPGAPTPEPSEYDDVVHRLREGACFEPTTSSEIVDVITMPSVAVAMPDRSLVEAQRAFTGHAARVLRDGASATLDFASPHACDANVPLKGGQRVKVVSIARIPKGNFGVTSVGPSGIPASTGLPAKAPRFVPDAVTVSLASSDALQADSITLVFASTDELRQYLKSL